MHGWGVNKKRGKNKGAKRKGLTEDDSVSPRRKIEKKLSDLIYYICNARATLK